MRKLLFAVFFFLIHAVASQTISGVVKEKGSGLPLPFANVFINNTTLGAATDADGKFVIQGKIPEEFELVASFVGFKTVSQTVIRKGRQAIFQSFELELLEDNLSEVELKARRDKSWERNYKRFREVFLAVPDDPYGRDIEIENPWVLDFENVRNEKGFNYTKASADLPLKVVNRALGYEIDYYLQDFRMLRNASRFYGQAFYRELQSEDSLTQKQWEDGRQLNYQNSVRHLALSLLLRNSGVQGFDLYHNQPESALRNRTNDVVEEMNKSIVPLSVNALYNKPLGNGIYRIFVPGRVEIHHRTKPWPNDYYTNYYNAISWMDAPSGYFDVDRNGTLINPTQLVLSGYIGRQRVARSLPLDFVPDEGFSGLAEELQIFQSRYIKLNTLREKAWLSTNKPYFHPGETLWLGGRMLYQNPINSDSLSRVLYVDLVDTDLKKVREESFRIEEGRISGGLVLDGNIPPGDYLLRAYTRWNINFPETDIFQMPVPILTEGTIPVVPELDRETFFGDIALHHKIEVSDSVNYRVMDLELEFFDGFQNPVATNFILTLLDSSVPVEISDKSRLENELGWVDVSLPESFDSEMLHPIEYGISVEGRFFPDRKKASAANEITLVEGDLEDYGTVVSDSLGRFWATGLNFQDTAQVAVAALDDKLKPFGRVELSQFQKPAFRGSFPKLIYKVKSLTVQSESFLDTSGDYILLEEFVKEADEERETMADRNYGYGEPTQQVGPEDLEQMTMAEIWGKLRFTGRKFGNYTYGEQTGMPLLIIDGQSRPFLAKGEFDEILGSYEPSQLRSIKVYSDNISKSVFGMAGYAGVIMIETKNGFRTGPESEKKFNSEGFQVFEIRGFTTYPEFPKKSPTDQFLKKKPTVYWDPPAKTESGIFKARIQVPYGMTKLSLRVEGWTLEGDVFWRLVELEL
ncbi:carboxypeptidase-like regulatory domain-containing protein [Algoriphagus aestuariicola]|uniref:Carboxypeptidase-like regulatory domain-containing protein n=1 Tax=Algoriphagus aestuariicola TaxID=1852016 RepID=A0ABS3BMA7_9BACT|nr:carboxypeptidase-like regulatory domain-containing protein [Algoriphagus aestuariicola]MBN7800440.1 carboxypeptidase-like regulatory domain-containing protein [Algoriphagus aestuariicola]